MKFVISSIIFACIIAFASSGSPQPPQSSSSSIPSSSLPHCIYCKDFMEIEELIPTRDCDDRGERKYEAIIVRLEPVFEVLHFGYCIGYYKIKTTGNAPRGGDEGTNIVYQKVVE